MTSMRPLARCLIDAVCGEPSPDAVAAILRLPLDDVMGAAAMHRIRPAVRRELASDDTVPESWRERFESVRHMQLINHLRALADLTTIAGLFADGGVRWVVAKGPMLASVVWPHPDMREYTDLDVFVHPEDFRAALHALESNGFTFVDRNWPEVLRQNRAELAMRGPTGFPLDLHWDLAVSRESRREFATDLPAMLGRAVTAQLGSGPEVPVFDATDTVLHTAHHAAGSGAGLLVWIADVRFAAGRAGVDWRELESRAAAAGMLTPVALVLARAERVFGVVFPMTQRMRRCATRSVIARLAIGRESRHPFPGLPGDEALSGTEYAGSRDGLVATGVAVVRRWRRTRQTEARIAEHGPDVNPLDEDVPDDRARDAYLAGLVA